MDAPTQEVIEQATGGTLFDPKAVVIIRTDREFNDDEQEAMALTAERLGVLVLAMPADLEIASLDEDMMREHGWVRLEVPLGLLDSVMPLCEQPVPGGWKCVLPALPEHTNHTAVMPC